MRYDLYYIKYHSLRLDLQILLRRSRSSSSAMKSCTTPGTSGRSSRAADPPEGSSLVVVSCPKMAYSKHEIRELMAYCVWHKRGMLSASSLLVP